MYLLNDYIIIEIMKTEICLILIILSAICKEPGDLSKAGVLKKKNPFFGLKLHPDDG